MLSIVVSYKLAVFGLEHCLGRAAWLSWSSRFGRQDDGVREDYLSRREVDMGHADHV